MKIHNYDIKLPELLNCPFCGAEPIAFLKGNKFCTKISITIKCPKCLINRETGAINGIINGIGAIEWLEGKVIELWNNRVSLKKTK
jgi:hypothetical protein